MAGTQSRPRTGADNAAKPKRLDLYFVDTGTNAEPRKVVDAYLEVFKDLLSRHHLFVLSHKQSIELLKMRPDLLGEDPFLFVVDTDARKKQRRGGYGVRVSLRDRPKQELRWILRTIADPVRARNLPAAAREEVHKEGLSGAIEIVWQTIEAVHS